MVPMCSKVYVTNECGVVATDPDLNRGIILTDDPYAGDVDCTFEIPAECNRIIGRFSSPVEMDELCYDYVSLISTYGSYEFICNDDYISQYKLTEWHVFTNLEIDFYANSTNPAGNKGFEFEWECMDPCK